MESLGEVGRIQVEERTAKLLLECLCNDSEYHQCEISCVYLVSSRSLTLTSSLQHKSLLDSETRPD